MNQIRYYNYLRYVNIKDKIINNNVVNAKGFVYNKKIMKVNVIVLQIIIVINYVKMNNVNKKIVSVEKNMVIQINFIYVINLVIFVEVNVNIINIAKKIVN